VIPSPARIENLQFGDKKVEVILKKTPKLEATLHMNLALNRENREVWRGYREVVLERGGSTTTPEVFDIQELESFDLLSVELLHKDSSLTLGRDRKEAPLLRPTEPFLKTLDSFCSLSEFEKMLFQPGHGGKRPQDVFEDAVAWLLSLAGFDVIRLKLGRNKFDELRVGEEYQEGSADIIAYEESKRILLVQCTSGPVDPVEVQRLADTKKYFRRKLIGYEKLPIVPILFSPRDFRKTSPSIDVMIADHSVIKRLFRAVVRGDHEKARSILNYSGM
jgi:hypothetical protein